ncbi:hypothetical protein K474DRAFT_1666521 [Panus rudis PR-1116 ss-1]|nr:hypothetical protein K474DRAFT_1666521 [Panus rudis PR-1116 ss-1]
MTYRRRREREKRSVKYLNSPQFLEECRRLAEQAANPPPSRLARLLSDELPPDEPTEQTYPLTERQAKLYYAGLPSLPVLVARTSTTPFKLPSGVDDDENLKELCPTAGSHPIKEIWGTDTKFSRDLLAYLDEKKVQWTSIDIVRIGPEDQWFKPVVIWVGIQPGSLTGRDGREVVLEVQRRLREEGEEFEDVEVEIRESIVTRW